MNGWAIWAMWSSVVVMGAVNIVLLHRNHLAMNSRLSELMEAQGIVREAKGFKEGRLDHLAGLRKADAALDAERSNDR